VLILAAGQGKRMRSALPKVLHPICGQPILCHILRQVHAAAPHARVGIVVGHGREQVEAAIRERPEFAAMDIHFILQTEQRGTGHAARCAMEHEWGTALAESRGSILVLPGDLPLIPRGLIEQMMTPMGRSDVLRLLTCELVDPTGYGRIVRRGKAGSVLRIVEERDANPRERMIREVALSIYRFQGAFLKYGTERLSDRNAQGEYYLTDLIAMAAQAKKKIDVLRWASAEDVRGVNDPWELAQAGRILNERCIREWALKGARFVDPWSNRIDVGVEIGEEAIIHPGAVLLGRTRIGRGATIGVGCVLTDVEVGEGAQVKTGTVAESSRIGERAMVGPYAHLRPESDVGADAKIGNFVELKKARVGAKTSVAHLSYVGDAEIGRNVNIGCGFVTCNYDGRLIDGQRKHRTVIEDDVFLGSDCQVIAPVRIGKGAYVASGSTITEDVEPGAMAIARSRQVNKQGYAKKLRNL
jgi:bifunctional UDP-N-acetylglucosamine pyrophosphorylase / glucosamine-1-phosphate N-acetyltransferase